MKKWQRVLAGAMLTAGLSTALLAEEEAVEIKVRQAVSEINLLNNAGFEEPLKEAGDWFTDKTFTKVEHLTKPDIAKTGNACVKVADFQFYRQSVKLDPDSEYILTVWAKAGNPGAEIYLWAKPAMPIEGKSKISGSIVSTQIKATPEKYEKYEFSFGSMPQNGKAPAISTIALSAVKGAVFVDDAFLGKVTISTSLKVNGNTIASAALYEQCPNADKPIFESGSIKGVYEKTVENLSTIKKYYWVITGSNGELKKYNLELDSVEKAEVVPADFLTKQAQKRLEKQEDKLILFGDSTTATRGALNIYGQRLEKEFVDFTIINAGVGGNTTDMAKVRFEKDVLAHNPKLVIIQFGINDSCVDVWKKPPATQTRVALDKYGENIKGFIKALKEKGAKVILMTPNPCRWTEGLRKRYDKPPYETDDDDGWNVSLVKYAAKVREIADAEKIPLIDVYTEFQNYDKKEGQDMNDLLLDGMHPNGKGHKIIADMLIKIIHQITEK